ncbi:MAG: hypothetical protein ACI92E_000539 [Oceanicoccus sp.]
MIFVLVSVFPYRLKIVMPKRDTGILALSAIGKACAALKATEYGVEDVYINATEGIGHVMPARSMRTDCDDGQIDTMSTLCSKTSNSFFSL